MVIYDSEMVARFGTVKRSRDTVALACMPATKSGSMDLEVLFVSGGCRLEAGATERAVCSLEMLATKDYFDGR